MPNTNYPPSEGHNEGNKRLTQMQIIFAYLQTNVATASMITEATGILQKNITRRKRDLEKAGRLWQVTRKRCAETKRLAWYLTTDPSKAPQQRQLTLDF
jgi:DNA-binding MarR family transcriptional regulator